MSDSEHGLMAAVVVLAIALMFAVGSCSLEYGRRIGHMEAEHAQEHP